MNGISYGDLAALAENAYVYLDKLEDVGGDYRIADDLELAITINKEDDRFDGKFTPEQAADFVANWSVVDHRPNTDAGFSSTLFKNAAGEYVLAFRGTEQFIDDFLVSDIGDIARDGLAIAQIIDMYNEYQRLSSPAGTAYDMAKLRLLEDETQAYEQALFEAQDPYGTGEGVDALDFLRARGDIIVDSGKVYAVDLVTSTDIYPEGDEWRLASGALHGQTLAAVTGHSLGGHLAMAFSRLFGVEALAINGAGFGFTQNPASMADTTVNNLLALLDGADSFDSKMILNIYGDKGWEFVAQHGPVLFQPGGYEPAFIETTPFLTYGHGKEQMTDALAVFDLFVRLVPGLNALAPDAVLARFNRLLEASSDKAASSFDAIVGTLSDLLITDGSLDSVDADNTRALSYAHLIAVKNKIESLPVVDRQLIDIQDYSSADALAEAATSDVALRYALLNLDPFAISGDDALYVQHNSAGELNLYDSSIGEGLTGQYLKDRAKFVKTLSDWADADGLPSLSMDGGLWHFEDVAGDIEVYNALYSTDPSVERVQYFRFGTDLANEPDALVGGGQADFLYGGDGADYLEGKAGADYLEGGKGDDIYVAGNGDLIFDHDGEGRVTFNGQPVGGGIFDSASGKYLSLDGGLFYSLSGDTLSVEQAGSGDTLTIKRFSSGALGIDLAAAPAAVVTETQKTGTAASELWDVTHGGPSTDPSYDGLPGVEYVLKDFDSLNTFNLADHLIGGDGDDWIEAWEAPWYDGEYLGHAPDTDIVEGGRGQDFISGGPGDDRLYATDAVDAESVSQGLGSAEYNTGIAAADASWLYSEVDIVNGSLGEDEIYGSGGRDILHGGFGSDLIYAGNGNDYIDGDHDFALTWTWAGARGWDYQSDGRVVMTASDSRGIADPDDAELVIYLAPGANDTIFAGNGHDNVQGGFHDDVVYGGDGNDSIQGDSSKVDDLGIPIVPSQLHGRDYLAGEGGDDTIDGNGGDDIVYGGTGNDLLDGDSRYFASSTDAEYHGDDYVDGGTGDDTISGSGGADILLGGAGSDVLFGDLDGLDAMHHGDDVLYGDDGNDQLVGQGGDDVLNGGTGNDILYGDDLDVGAVQGNDQLFGGAGADELSGGLGADTLSGGEDDDGLWGDAGDDRLSGGKGGDYLEGGAGADTYVLSAGDGPENGAALDTIVDGAGQDNRLEFASNVDTGSIRLNPVADSADLIIHYADGDTVYVAGALAGSIDAYSFDGLSFTPYRDFLAAHIPNAQYLDGDAADNLVFGDGSGSPLSGAAGDDTLVGGAGDDILDGGAGANRLIGGAGADVYQINATPQIGWVSASLNIIVDNDDRSSVVRFGAGVRPIDFTGYQEFTYDTAIIISSPFNSLVIVDGKYGNVVNRFEFADGSAYTFSEFKALITEAPTVIEGDQQPQLLSGTPGRDSINGAAGADTLSGDDGGDSLDGGEGADSLVGGLGNDTYVVDDAGDIVVEAAHEGYDKVLASVDYALPDHVEALELTGPDATTGTGNALDNHLVGTGNTLLLTGGDGSDYIQGADTVDGGAGDDELHGFVVYGGDGNDRIYASAPNGYNLPQPQLWGGAGDDVYTLDNHYQTSLRAEIGESADEGTDTLILRSHVIIMPELPQHIENVRYEFTGSVWFGADGVRLGGNDLDNLIEVGRGNPDGNYVLEGFAGNDTLIGSEFDDSGSGTLGLYGGEGDDLLQGRQGDDLLDGGAGSDTLEGGSGNDVLNGMDGNDRLYGGDGSDVLEGGQGSDSLDGGRGADTLDGGAGNDYLIADDQHGGSVFRGGTGDDVLAGSRNADTYHYRSGDGRDIIDERYGHAGHTDLLILEDLDPTDVAVTRDGSSLLIDVVTDGGQIVLWKWYDNPSNRLESIEFENQTLWDMQTLHDLGLEVVFGATNDRLEGLNNQPDRMYGGGGEDSLYGYGEADQLNGDGGNDLIEGGAGDDVLTGGDGADTLEGGDGNDFLYGNTGADRISGGQGNDYVHGGKGNDSMYGNTGDDTMLGGADNDSLHGGKDNDLLFGKDGDDTLLGGAGDDTLHGDAGNDYLSGVAGNDSYRYYAGGGQDEIAEFDGNDQLLFMDIGHDQLWFKRLGDNLVISVIGTPDQVAVNDWYLDASKHIEVFHSGDSMALENTGLEQLVNAMASFQKPSMGQTSLSSELRDDLSPYLAAAWQ